MELWNHNVHYCGVVLRAVPKGCGRALDVGCGQGGLARELAQFCERTIGIDADGEILALARAAGQLEERVAFIEGDAMTYAFPDGNFDLITAVASLHHLPLRPALRRFGELLRPGGVLAVIGLYRVATAADYAYAAAAIPASRAIRIFRGSKPGEGRGLEPSIRKPKEAEPQETLGTIRAACDEVLPGGKFKRRLLYRYSFVWRKPEAPADGRREA